VATKTEEMAPDRAKRALNDCRYARGRFGQQAQLEEDFRTNVVLCLTLLRAVGHVLVSEGDDNALKSALDATWPTKKAEANFHRLY
jgi:hypothetical protein